MPDTDLMAGYELDSEITLRESIIETAQAILSAKLLTYEQKYLLDTYNILKLINGFVKETNMLKEKFANGNKTRTT